MDINSFAEIVRDKVKEQLGSNYHVTICETDKNNGVVYTGLKVEREDSDVSPLIYLNGQFMKYENGDSTLPEITDYITSVGRRKEPKVDIRQFLNYDSVSERIVYKLINTERNSKLLEDIPHVEFLDLSVVFQCMLAGESNNTASILVHNVHMKLWDVTADDLLKAAEKNTPQLMGCEIKSMKDVIGEIMKEKTTKDFDCEVCKEGLEGGIPMYVLTNKYRVDGASCMLYPKFLSNICDMLKSSFYIIPSSIHEVLLLPVDNTDGSRQILAMIKEVNDTQVAAEEILSYSLFYYDMERHQLSIVEPCRSDE